MFFLENFNSVKFQFLNLFRLSWKTFFLAIHQTRVEFVTYMNNFEQLDVSTLPTIWRLLFQTVNQKSRVNLKIIITKVFSKVKITPNMPRKKGNCKKKSNLNPFEAVRQCPLSLKIRYVVAITRCVVNLKLRVSSWDYSGRKSAVFSKIIPTIFRSFVPV